MRHPSMPANPWILDVPDKRMTYNDGPLVGIGLPVFNGERFLRRAIDSVLAQSLAEWELVISDNGSTDQTEEIARTYAQRDSRIRYFRNAENLGASANFEIAFRMSRGRYFCWLAYDDWYHPDYLSRCVEVLESNPGAALCFTAMGVVDESGEVFRSRTEPLVEANSQDPAKRFHTVLWHLEDPTAPVFGVSPRRLLTKTGLIRNANEPDRILLGELSLLGSIHQLPARLFYHYGPPGHTVRDNWVWLNPLNRGKPRFATIRIIYHQLRAVISSPSRPLKKLAMVGDLLLAVATTRTRGKMRIVFRRFKSGLKI